MSNSKMSMDWAAGLALGSAAIIIFSICYEWSYFWMIGHDFLSFLQIADHVNSALELIPAFIAILFLIVCLVLRNWANNKDSGNDALGDERKMFPVAQIGDAVIYNYALRLRVLIVGTAIYLTLFAYLHFYVLISIFLLVVWWWEYFFWRLIRKLWEEGQRVLSSMFYVAPVLLAAGASFAFVEAHSDLTKKVGSIEIRTTSGRYIEGQVLLRTSQSGVLIRNPHTDQIIFKNWSEIDLMRKKRSYDSRSISCRYFNLGCKTS